jgi:uncharacterized protein
MLPDSALFTKLLAPLPLFDLFEQLQPKLQLTLEQYEALKQSLWLGYGATSWDDLQRVCGLLWVRPSYDNSHQKLFDREFDYYRQRLSDLPVRKPIEVNKSNTEQSSVTTQLLLPAFPKRVIPDDTQSNSSQAATGVETLPAQERNFANDLKILPTDLPISVLKVRESWRLLKQIHRLGMADEIDLDRTVAKISRVGFVQDVVLRPSWSQRSELVVLVDEGKNMLPYFPALAPLFKAIEGGWIHPAAAYRFTGYPAWFLSQWQDPERLVAIDDLLKRLHRLRTVVMVISDMGAANGEIDADRRQGTKDFLRCWQPCVRQILWINPVPKWRWQGTMAAEINQELDKKMLWLGDFDSRTAQRLWRSGRW